MRLSLRRGVTNIAGLRFGRLVVQAEVGRRSGAATWRCLCDCGQSKVVKGTDLRRRHTQSCGCLQAERAGEANRARSTHGLSRSSEYYAWQQLIMRCTNINNAWYSHYGGRGIQVCERWLESFENFLADMGKKPSANHSIDRVDNDGNYEPGNCRWATASQQAFNRRKWKRAVNEG